jgi:hypothetical protein
MIAGGAARRGETASWRNGEWASGANGDTAMVLAAKRRLKIA